MVQHAIRDFFSHEHRDGVARVAISSRMATHGPFPDPLVIGPQVLRRPLHHLLNGGRQRGFRIQAL